MAGLDLVLNSLRGAGQGVRSLGDGIQSGQEAQARQDELNRRNEAERVRKERLGELSSNVQGLVDEAVRDPNFNQRSFVQKSQPIIEGSLELNDPNILRSLDPIQEIINQREREKRAEIATESEKQKEARRLKEEREKADRANRNEAADIQDRFDKQDVTKQTNIVRQAFTKIDKAAEAEPSAANDMSMVFSFMKLLDPGSVVRESEFKSAAEARGFFSRQVVEDEDGNLTTRSGTPIPSFVAQALQKAAIADKGAFLLPEQRETFRSVAEDNYRAQLENQLAVDDRALSQINAIKADRKQIIPRLASEDLAELDAKKRAKAAKKKNDELNVSTGVKDTTNLSSGNSGSKLVDAQTMDKIMKANAQQFQDAISKLNASRAAQGQPPVSDEEKNTYILQLIKKNGIQVAPGG